MWTAPPLERVFPDTAPARGQSATVRLWAARGERESFQICLRTDGGSAPTVSLETEAVDERIGAPGIWRVGYLALGESSREAPGTHRALPDPLVPFRPFQPAPGETCALWVTYAVPRHARPGAYSTCLRIMLDGECKGKIRVRLQVFDFELPAVPSLRTLFALDRGAMCSFYGLDPASLPEWKPFYRALSQHRLSYSVWDPAGFVKASSHGRADTTALKQHLAY